MIKSLYGLVLKVMNITITISAKYSDNINILASIIILLIWSFKSPIGAPDIVYLQKGLNNLTMKNRFNHYAPYLDSRKKYINRLIS